jgi:hypothetical protein
VLARPTPVVFGGAGHSGPGVGHVAVQLAKRMDARVLGVAAGASGVELVEGPGADAARRFAPDGLDADLLTAGLRSLRDLVPPLQPHPHPRSLCGLWVFPEFFERVVELCIEAGLVWGEKLYFDATKVDANA